MPRKALPELQIIVTSLLSSFSSLGYIAMLMTNWGSPSAVGKDQIDVGWTSVWVKIVSQWLMGGLYTWVLVAPLIMKDRDFDL